MFATRRWIIYDIFITYLTKSLRAMGQDKLQIIEGLLAMNPILYQTQTEITNDSPKNNGKH